MKEENDARQEFLAASPVGYEEKGSDERPVDESRAEKSSAESSSNTEDSSRSRTTDSAEDVGTLHCDQFAWF
ncbi:unnamed protein product [Anisakis simplex]|uniref:Uncharacterized protein n=1 Tax=Anisakis simplex TaxID=6269 RepID=A0A3P6QBU1_ANISI|nr:unnamed protein product [Anisakis simplex]